MRVIPVIDLKGGEVVHGVAGRRDSYRPVRSLLAEGSEPGSVATAFVKQFGFRTVYVADLDAIGGDEPDWPSIRAIAGAGLSVWLDAGIGDEDRARSMAKMCRDLPFIETLIIGLESLGDWAEREAIFSAIGADRSAFSLDMMHGAPLARSGSVPEDPLDVVADAFDAGVRRFIVLDLASVGVSGGPASPLCREMRKRFAGVQIVAGGGVRDETDLSQLAEAGCDAALVATALHNGRLTPASVVTHFQAT